MWWRRSWFSLKGKAGIPGQTEGGPATSIGPRVPPVGSLQQRELWRFSRLRQVKYLNNIVEQDHRRIKRLVRPGLGFGSLPTAPRTLAGYEGMAMIRKGQVRNIGGGDMRAQAAFVAGLFGIAA